MRLSAFFLRLTVFAAAGAVAYSAARVTVSVVEARSVEAVERSLLNEGFTWATVVADGLQVILEGEAQTEAERFRAISAAGEMVDASRIIDSLSVIDSAQIAPPEFAMEILRNDSGVSLIGLIPASTDRDRLASQITGIATDQPIADLLEAGDYPAPDTWRPALNYGLRALELLPRSKISITAQKVSINAIADSDAEKRQMEIELARNTPAGVMLDIRISAPRPVISPFTARFSLDDSGASFDACAADTPEARDIIIAAATAAGFNDKPNCTLALGAPSRTWGEAVAMAITAVNDLGGGTVTVSDTDIALQAPLGTDQRLFDNVVGGLDNALPDAFALSADLPLPPEPQPEGVPQFTATRSPEGQVQLRGRLPDDMTSTVTENFASAKFGQQNVIMGTRVVTGLPNDWAVRVLAGVEALSELSNGAVTVEPDTMLVRGATGNPDASAAISRLLIEKLGQSASFEIDVTYVEQLDPIAALPSPEECIIQIKSVTDTNKITFDPGSASLAADTQPVIDAIAEILRACGDLRIRVSGFTDSQGREEMNLSLSQDRAEAVLTALQSRRVPVGTFEAIGYGEENPIADNDTEEGREANRRIEFSLIQPESTPERTTALDEIAAASPLAGADDAPDGETAPDETAEDTADPDTTQTDTPPSD